MAASITESSKIHQEASPSLEFAQSLAELQKRVGLSKDDALQLQECFADAVNSERPFSINRREFAKRFTIFLENAGKSSVGPSGKINPRSYSPKQVETIRYLGMRFFDEAFETQRTDHSLWVDAVYDHGAISTSDALKLLSFADSAQAILRKEKLSDSALNNYIGDLDAEVNKSQRATRFTQRVLGLQQELSITDEFEIAPFLQLFLSIIKMRDTNVSDRRGLFKAFLETYFSELKDYNSSLPPNAKDALISDNKINANQYWILRVFDEEICERSSFAQWIDRQVDSKSLTPSLANQILNLAENAEDEAQFGQDLLELKRRTNSSFNIPKIKYRCFNIFSFSQWVLRRVEDGTFTNYFATQVMNYAKSSKTQHQFVHRVLGEHARMSSQVSLDIKDAEDAFTHLAIQD